MYVTCTVMFNISLPVADREIYCSKSSAADDKEVTFRVGIYIFSSIFIGVSASLLPSPSGIIILLARLG